MTQKYTHHIYILFAFNALFIAMYFSGIPILQDIISLNHRTLNYEHTREFGVVENLQSLFLLLTIYLMVKLSLQQYSYIKIGFAIITVFFIFLLAEELDYGIHFYRLLTSNFSDSRNFNLHNLSTSTGGDINKFLKRTLDLINLIWFIILPVFFFIKKKPKLIIPPLTLSIALLVGIIFSRIASELNSSGFGIINGLQGSLDGNISEFRELSVYYIYYVYALYLVNNKVSCSSISDLFKSNS